MTENVPPVTETTAPAPAEAPAPAATPAKPTEKYPAMHFVAHFARLTALVIAIAFIVFALVSIGSGILTEASFMWGLINGGFYLLIGSVLVGLVRGAGEVFELLLDLEKRK